MPSHRKVRWHFFRRNGNGTHVFHGIVGSRSHTAAFYNFTDAWSNYAANVVGSVALSGGHYPAAQAPVETYREPDGFFSV
jgi:hypothetical protein